MSKRGAELRCAHCGNWIITWAKGVTAERGAWRWKHATGGGNRVKSCAHPEPDPETFRQWKTRKS